MHRRRKLREKRRKAIEKVKSAIPLASHAKNKSPKIPKEELDDNAHFDLELRFPKKSPELKTERKRFVKALKKRLLPKGFRPPIASGSKREKTSRRNIETLLANIHKMIDKKKPWLSVSLSPNTYSGRKINAGIINVIKLAAHPTRKLLQLKKGYRNPTNPEKSRLARIRPTQKLYDLLCKQTDINLRREPDDLIVLRRTKTILYKKGGGTYTKQKKKKVFVPRKHWEKDITKEQAEKLHIIREGLRRFNSAFSKFKMTYRDATGKKHILTPALHAVYTDDFEHGGRFYTCKGGHQQLSKEERKTIRFNGHRTKELDYGGLHIRMLYHLAKLHYPRSKDPYVVVLEAMGKNPEQMKIQLGEDDYELIRDDLKEVLLAFINGTIKAKHPKVVAVSRANWRLFKKWEEIEDPESKADEQLKCERRKERWQNAGLLNYDGSCTEVLRAFREAHKAIEHYFSTGYGLDLQNIDARIAFHVMSEMMGSEKDQCIPTLPVHDSFITFRKRKYRTKLRRVMKMFYKRVMQEVTKTRRRFKIPVKGNRS